MALSPAQRHSQRIAMEQKLKRSQALETTESMHLLVRALETDVEYIRSLPTIADRVEYKRNVLLPRWVPTVESGQSDTCLFSGAAAGTNGRE